MNCPHCGTSNAEDSEVCSNCGEALTAPVEDLETKVEEPVEEATALVDSLEPVDEMPVATEAKSSKVKGWMLVAGIVVVIALIVVGVLQVSGGLKLAGASQFVFGTPQDNGVVFQTIYQMDSNGQNKVQVADDANGLLVPASVPGFGHSQVSPDGSYVAAVSNQNQTAITLSLYSSQFTTPTVLSSELVPYDYLSFFNGFSPSGQYYAYTTLGQSDTVLASAHVQDMQGNEILKVDNTLFTSFTADGKGIIVLSFDPTQKKIVEIQKVDVASGNVSTVTPLQSSDTDQGLFARPFLSPDGKDLYYFSESKLYKVAISNGTPTVVNEFKGTTGIAYVAPDKKDVVLLDFQGDKAFDLALYNLSSGQVTPIDQNIAHPMILGPLDLRTDLYNTQLVDTSKNGKYLAYQVQRDGKTDLYVSDNAGTTHTLIASGTQWFQFAITADGKNLVYLQPADKGPMGAVLNVVPLAGGTATKLDENVWSFRLTGNRLMYFQISSPADGKYQSTLFQVNTDGSAKKSLADASDGILTFISH